MLFWKLSRGKMCIMWQFVYISDSQWAMCSWFGAGSSCWIWAGLKTGLNQHEIEIMLCQVRASVLGNLAASAFVLLRDLNRHLRRMATHLQSPHGAKERPSQTSTPTASCPYRDLHGANSLSVKLCLGCSSPGCSSSPLKYVPSRLWGNNGEQQPNCPTEARSTHRIPRRQDGSSLIH